MVCTCWTREAAEVATYTMITIKPVIHKITSAINLSGRERELTFCTKANRAEALYQGCEKVIGNKV